MLQAKHVQADRHLPNFAQEAVTMHGLGCAVGAGTLAMMAALAFAQQSGAPGNPPMSSIGYPSVAAALDALKARTDVRISSQGGWTVIEDGSGGNATLWSFTPPNHPAHPAAVKRTLVQKDGAFFVEMDALCQATKAACDALMAEFQELNNRMRESIERSRQPRAPTN